MADAKALEPLMQTAPAQPDADKRLLQAYARACGRWSPYVAPDPGPPGEDGILLDISGCARLFGGEDKLIEAALLASRERGLTAYAATAPSIGLAWGLARFKARQSETGWIRADTVETALADLPVEGLRIGETAGQLRRFGLKRAGDLLTLPRASLTRRFGAGLLTRLDQAAGRVEESLNPLQPVTECRARLRFPEPLLLLDSLKQCVDETAKSLCEQLEPQGLGLRRVELNLYRIDGKLILLGIGTAAPARDPAHIARLLHEKLDRAEIDIGFGIDVVELRARETAPLGGRQAGLLHTGEPDPDDLDQLTDRLVVRLGDEQVRRAGRRESHIPERAAGWRPGPALAGTALSVREADQAPADFTPPDPDRPLLILARPEPAQAVAEIPDGPPRSFIWRRVRHLVHRAEGPERLAPEWWRDQLSARTRDYFRVETREGRRFWLYREGLFGLETRTPNWFVHGAS